MFDPESFDAADFEVAQQTVNLAARRRRRKVIDYGMIRG